MKVILLNGSPHANGNTATALKEMETIFTAEGIETETIQVGHLQVRGCTGCASCYRIKKCVFDDIMICADSPQRVEQINKTWQYIKTNWEGIMNSYDTRYIGCSAEGHVSHILSERLSSRPLGWSYIGVNDMAKLRAFRANNGNVYEVIKRQKRDNKRNGIKKITENAVKRVAKNINTVYTDVKPVALENGLKNGLYKALHAICYAM